MPADVYKNITKIDDETIARIKAMFLRYPLYKQLKEEFEDISEDMPLSDMITYRCSSYIENSRVTSSRSLRGQPEVDALRIISMNEKQEKENGSRKRIIKLEAALSDAMRTASKKARPKNRDELAAALYDHLCLGVPMNMLRKKITTPTLSTYRDEAIVLAAVNLGFISSESIIKKERNK